MTAKGKTSPGKVKAMSSHLISKSLRSQGFLREHEKFRGLLSAQLTYTCKVGWWEVGKEQRVLRHAEKATAAEILPLPVRGTGAYSACALCIT